MPVGIPDQLNQYTWEKPVIVMTYVGYVQFAIG